jgi:glycogen synthase
MRIMILSDLYPPYFIGGYELKCKLQTEELAKRGHELFVLASAWQVGQGKVDGNVYRLLRYDDFVHGGFTQSSSLVKRLKQWRWVLDWRKNYAVARETAAALRPDLVYIWHMANACISPILAMQDLGLPTVFQMCDYSYAQLKAHFCLERNPIKRKYRAVIGGGRDFGRVDFSHILVVSRAVMRYYVQRGFSERSFTVLPQGVPDSMILKAVDLPNRSPVEDRLRLLFVGRLVPNKGTHVAIEAVQHLIREAVYGGTRLDIIGTGPEEYVDRLYAMTTASGLQKNVNFVGFLEHEQVLARFGEYDAVLIPSLWEEPLSGTIAEAMARGLPVITTDRGGAREVIADGENGLVVPAGDPAALAEAIRTLARDPHLCGKIRLAALNTVRNGFSNERIVDQVEEYFQRVLQQARPGWNTSR